MARPKAMSRSVETGPAVAPTRAGAERNVIVSDPYSEVAEAIHALRARVQSQHLQAGRRALAICGPTPEVGCTFVAVNLAVALAQIGVKTLLVDGDLRSPSIQSYFEPELTGPGLFEALISPSAPLIEFTNEDVLPNLDVLTAGNPDRTAHELLAGDAFPDLINVCMRDYDLTIVDTPPANSCSDGLRISTVVGFSLIVVRKQRTLVSDVKVLADQLKKERAGAIGTVLNAY
ncbi:MAG: CpsD/CapB family tyrosine-protein kinase [Phenylobacterium sp.]